MLRCFVLGEVNDLADDVQQLKIKEERDKSTKAAAEGTEVLNIVHTIKRLLCTLYSKIIIPRRCGIERIFVSV